MVTINGRSIYERNIIVFICMLFFVEPAYFEQIDLIDKIYTYGGFVCVLFLILLFVFEIICKKNISFAEVWIFLFFGVIFLSTIFQDGNIYLFAKKYYPLFGTCLLFDLWLTHNPRTLINTTEFLNIYVYINLITVLLFPGGLYSSTLYTANWFLGYKNPEIRIILPIIVLELIRSYWKYGKLSIKSYVLLACSAITFLLINSITAIIGFVVFAILLILFHRRDKALPKFINLFNCVIVTVLAFIGLFIIQIQNQFSTFLETVLGSDISINARVRVWGNALSYIRNKLVFGYGFLSDNEYASMLGNQHFTHPHNYFLYLLMTGGVILVIIFLIGIVYADYKLFKNMDNLYNKIILFSLFAFFIMGIVESLVSTVFLYPLLILAMESDKIAQLKYGERNERAVNIKIRFKLN